MNPPSSHTGSRNSEVPMQKYIDEQNQQQPIGQKLKYFKGQDLELYYAEKQLKPGIEKEIKEGFFEIKKKFGDGDSVPGEATQVYVSHLCLHNYHPIFSKLQLEVVKIVLNFSQIIYLQPGQTLYQTDFNERYLYIVLFGKLRLQRPQDGQQVGQILNIGWTAGEEILFKVDKNGQKVSQKRTEKCLAVNESCVLGIEKRSLA